MDDTKKRKLFERLHGNNHAGGGRMMGKAPDRIWFTPWDEGEENGTAGPASHTDGKPPNGDAAEYVRNTPEAMLNAGYVPIEQLDESKDTVSRFNDAYHNQENRLRAGLTRTQQQLETAQMEVKVFSGNANNSYSHYLQAADNISQLKLQVAASRNDALEEAAKIADAAGIGRDVNRRIAREIRAMKEAGE